MYNVTHVTLTLSDGCRLYCSIDVVTVSLNGCFDLQSSTVHSDTLKVYG